MYGPIRPHYLLLPASRGFITFSIVCAFLLNVLPWGHAVGVPDFLALVLVFWNIHQPRMVGMGIAFLFGLLMDVHDAALLGEHALAYSLLSYGALSLHRRVPWFHVPGQMLHVLPLFLGAQIVLLVVRMAVGGAFPGWTWFLQSFSSVLLWPLADWLLLAPQRRAVDRDENRPI
ncbi:MAG: rod shape-determining protein MreD [Burkholderiales bacterium]|nr:rod shape-determining protein MreD [Burkholderiales bacterium]